MNATATSYNLYCTNVQCRKSVYNEIQQIRVSFTKENILATHVCRGCLKPLISTMDVEIEHVLGKAGASLPKSCDRKSLKK